MVGDIEAAVAGDRDLSRLSVRALLEDAAKEAPSEPFLIHGDQLVTFQEFNRAVDRAASAWHRIGVRKGDRVAFVLGNQPEFLYSWLGLAKLGAILAACNTRWQAGEVGHFLRLVEPRFAIVAEEFRDTFSLASSGYPELERSFSFSPCDGFEDFNQELEEADGEVPHVDLRSDDPISFISTSGTTGRPKAVVQTHGNYVLTGEGYASWVELRRGERLYLCLPLFHINAQAYTVMGALAARAAIVLTERFSASRFWPDMLRYRVNVFNYIGSMIAVLLKRDPSPEERAHAVRLTYGGPAFPGAKRQEIERRFNLTLISGIGMSENTFGLIEPLHEERRSGSLGKPRQHPDPRIVNEARVVDDDGREVPDGAVGELIFRNPVLMKGYYRDPELTAETIRNGWLYTGDLVRRDEKGFFYFVGREKEIIRVRGENLSAIEVEEVLASHPDVQEVAVVGVPSELTDEEVAAFVVLAPTASATPDALIEWCRPSLASYKLPRHVWLVESLPKTETLRVEKHRLRERARDLLALDAARGDGT